ncbi:MAG TPA: penicillin acylase family protein [Gemmatimonadales bacterium]
MTAAAVGRLFLGDMRWVRRALAGASLLALLVVGGRRIGPLPPLGWFLDPWNGVWALVGSSELPASWSARIPGLTGPVNVVYDDRGVPHIYAATAEDAFRAQGYVVARDRLFQLELQTRATAGRLAELLGPSLLAVDREQRVLDLAASADREWTALDTTAEATRAARAYGEGVNAWIGQMPRGALPVEYRLLGVRRPMPWEPRYSAYMFRRMGYTLAYNAHEWTRERVVRLVGRPAADALFPVHAPIQEPIQPQRGPYPRFVFRSLPPPYATGAEPFSPLRASSRLSSPPEEGKGVGSNNWAVSPRRSASGHALLAGDPHLELSLPSIWYEIHLVVSGEFDVYGVAIPGLPGVAIGFNRDVAWSFTNTGNDVLDRYVETVDDSLSPSRYRLDGQWRTVERRVERYWGPRGDLLGVDTLYRTHRGPLSRRDDGRWVSLRWLVLEESFPTAFLRMMRARSADQWLDAMATYRVPAQNGIVADRAGTIAIRSTGAFPLRPGDGTGHTPRDGSLSANDWTGFWPLERLPFGRNPAQGYLASANQQPKDPATDPSYLDGDWFSPWRAIQINRLLRGDSNVTPDQMRRFQTHPGSARADLLLPEILAAGRAAAGTVPGTNGNPNDDLTTALTLLAAWDGRYPRENERAVLFELTISQLQNRLWDELTETVPNGTPRRAGTPSEAILLGVLRDRGSPWWDDRSTAGVTETRDSIVATSLRAALREARERFGDPAAGGWRWDQIRHANVFHLLRIAAFSALELPMQGGPSTLNPSSGRGTHGASWRMVVELGPVVRAWGTYPGGQSGNPLSRRYDDRLRQWVNGELDSLYMPAAIGAFDPGRVASRLSLKPGPHP